MELNAQFSKPELLMIGWIKMRKARRAYKAVLKRMKYRSCVIKEIIKTEQDYTRDIKIILHQVFRPINEQQILSADQQRDIILNLQEIADHNISFLDTLQSKFDNYSIYKVIFDETPKQVEGFEVYFDYCNGFTNATKALQEYLKNNQSFQDFMVTIRSSNILRGMNIDDFLVKPVQRLPKYVLLLKDLLKHTELDHPDYINIKHSLEAFQNMNEQNNKNMDKFMNRLRIQEFQNNYDINPSLLDDQERLFRFEETQTMIWNEIARPVYVFALTDVILVTYINDLGLSELFKLIYLDPSSFVKNSPNSKLFSYLYSVVGKNDTVQFISEDQASKKSSMALFQGLLSELRFICKENLKLSSQPFIINYPVSVTVVGTEERNFQSFSKHTIYITEINILKIALKLFIRYRDVQKLSQQYQKRYKSLKFPQFPSSQWLNNNQTKVIESRKITIENFLQVILSSDETRRDPRILQDLRLPQNFYELPDIIESQKQELAFNNIKIDYKNNLSQFGMDQKLMKISATEVWRARQESMTQELVHISSIVETKMGVNYYSPNKIVVFLLDGQQFKIGLQQDTRAAEVVKAIAHQIKLQRFYDFKIFLVDQLNNARMIDDDEIIFKVIYDETVENQGILSSMVDKVESVFFAVQQKKIRLEMRKFLTLPLEWEENDMKQDLVRLSLVSHQILQEVKTQHYQLNFKEYCLYAALFIFIKYKDCSVEFPKNKLLDIIPKQVYDSIQTKKWIETISDLIKEISQETNHIAVQFNNIQQDNLIMSQSQNVNTSSSLIQDQVPVLAQKIILNSIKTSQLYGTSLFFVEMTTNTVKKLKKELQGLSYPNIYLGINYQYLFLLTPSKKEVIKKYPLSKIATIQSYPMQIEFGLNYIRLDLEFMTYQSYELKMLIREYQGLFQFDEQYKVGIYKK